MSQSRITLFAKAVFLVGENPVSKYSNEFYSSMHQQTLYAVETILAHVLRLFPTIHSAVDVGFGVGTTLSVLKQNAADRIQGIDGSWVEENCLVIPKECFVVLDLSRPIHLDERFDLALSLEVAEHLPVQSSSIFVNSLVQLADIVLFSAAIPGQGGVYHINEQWQQFWAGLFKGYGYEVIDVLRSIFWNDGGYQFGTGRISYYS